MKTSDYIWLGILMIFGLWWLLFPQSVLTFYASIFKDHAKFPKPLVIRLGGLLWVTLIAVSFWTTFHKK